MQSYSSFTYPYHLNAEVKPDKPSEDVLDAYDKIRDYRDFMAEQEPEPCPVCGDPLEPGQDFCSTQCELRHIELMFSEDEDGTSGD